MIKFSFNIADCSRTVTVNLLNLCFCNNFLRFGFLVDVLILMDICDCYSWYLSCIRVFYWPIRISFFKELVMDICMYLFVYCFFLRRVICYTYGRNVENNLRWTNYAYLVFILNNLPSLDLNRVQFCFSYDIYYEYKNITGTIY